MFGELVRRPRNFYSKTAPTVSSFATTGKVSPDASIAQLASSSMEGPTVIVTNGARCARPTRPSKLKSSVFDSFERPLASRPGFAMVGRVTPRYRIIKYRQYGQCSA